VAANDENNDPGRDSNTGGLLLILLGVADHLTPSLPSLLCCHTCQARISGGGRQRQWLMVCKNHCPLIGQLHSPRSGAAIQGIL